MMNNQQLLDSVKCVVCDKIPEPPCVSLSIAKNAGGKLSHFNYY